MSDQPQAKKTKQSNLSSFFFTKSNETERERSGVVTGGGAEREMTMVVEEELLVEVESGEDCVGGDDGEGGFGRRDVIVAGAELSCDGDADGVGLVEEMERHCDGGDLVEAYESDGGAIGGDGEEREGPVELMEGEDEEVVKILGVRWSRRMDGESGHLREVDARDRSIGVTKINTHILFISMLTLSILQNIHLNIKKKAAVTLSNICPLCPKQFDSDGKTAESAKSLRRSLRSHIPQQFVLRLCGCQELLASDGSLTRHRRGTHCSIKGRSVTDITALEDPWTSFPVIVCDRLNYDCAALFVQSRTKCPPPVGYAFPVQLKFPSDMLCMPHNTNTNKLSLSSRRKRITPRTSSRRRKRVKATPAYAESDATRESEESEDCRVPPPRKRSLTSGGKRLVDEQTSSRLTATSVSTTPCTVTSPTSTQPAPIPSVHPVSPQFSPSHTLPPSSSAAAPPPSPSPPTPPSSPTPTSSLSAHPLVIVESPPSHAWITSAHDNLSHSPASPHSSPHSAYSQSTRTSSTVELVIPTHLLATPTLVESPSLPVPSVASSTISMLNNQSDNYLLVVSSPFSTNYDTPQTPQNHSYTVNSTNTSTTTTIISNSNNIITTTDSIHPIAHISSNTSHQSNNSPLHSSAPHSSLISSYSSERAEESSPPSSTQIVSSESVTNTVIHALHGVSAGVEDMEIKSESELRIDASDITKSLFLRLLQLVLGQI